MDLTNTEVSEKPSTPDSGDAMLHTDEDTSPTRRPPSEASSQEWDKVTNPGSQTPA